MYKTEEATDNSTLQPTETSTDHPSNQPSPSPSHNDQPSESPTPGAHVDSTPVLENKEKEESPHSSSSNIPLIDKDNNLDVTDSKPRSSSSVSSSHLNNGKKMGDGDKKTEPMNSTTDKPAENQSIILIKGKTSPKAHVIKVTEKKESDTKYEPTATEMIVAAAHSLVNSEKNEKNSSGFMREKTFSSHFSENSHGGRRLSMVEKQKSFIKMMKEEGTNADIAGDICRVFSVLFAIGVRSVLFGFSLFTVWLVVDRLGNDYYYILALTLILLIIETINIVVERAGQERKWFCLCFLCYLITTIPCMWILEMDRLNDYQSAVSNSSALQIDVAGVTADIKLDPNTLLAVTEQSLIFLLILCRWLLPRGDISRDQLSQLLFVYIGMASDVMELFTLFDEPTVRKDRTLTYIILTVWSVSLLQFTLVLTMSRNPKKVRTALDHDEETARMKKKRLKDRSLILVLTQSELWSLCISIFMQDGPFLGVRLFTLVKHNLVNYTIIFFTCKNILVIMLLLYRVMILILQKFEDSKKDDDGDEVDSKHDTLSESRHRTKTFSTHLSLSSVREENEASSGDKETNGNSNGSPDGIRARHNNQVTPL